MGKSDAAKGFVFKITVIGNGAVGKTSLIKKYTQGSFQKDYIKTYPKYFFHIQTLPFPLCNNCLTLN